MLKFNLVLSFLCVAIFISAQNLSNDFNVSLSKPYEVVDARDKFYFSDNKGFAYSVKTVEEKVTLQKFDVQNMKEVARKAYAVDVPYNRGVEILQVGDKFYYLFESLDKKSQKRSLHLREVLIDECEFGKEQSLITSEGAIVNSQNELRPGFMGVGTGSPFIIYKSFDESKILVTYRRKPISKRDAINYDLLGFYVFNTSLELQWGKEVKMPYTEKEMNNIAYTVAKDGTVYMTSLYTESEHLQLIKIPETGELSVSDIEGLGEDFYFKKLVVEENFDGNFNMAGYYYQGFTSLDFWFDKTSIQNTKGIKYFEISKEGKTLKSSTIEFPIKLINKYSSKYQQKKNTKKKNNDKAGLRNLSLREFTVNPDGSLFLLGEEYYIEIEYRGQSNSRVYTYNFRDLVAAKINPDGEVAWMKKLPKRQEGKKGKGGLGVSYLRGTDSHYILFLDNVKNAEIGINEIPEKHKDGLGGFLTAYKIDDATGSFTKHTLYDSKEVKGTATYQFNTTRILKATDNILLAEVYIKGKKDAIIKMEVKD